MYFFDSYALIEIIRGNKRYKKYLKEKPIITKLNLMEIYYWLLRMYGEEKAEYYYNFYLPGCVPISDDVIKKALKFRLKFRKEGKRLSYIDCISYIFALENNLRFLTGDDEFKNLKNVDFVK